ncbi:sensor histidine kinase [Saccharicrinis fermentans]|uniref:Putative sensor-like histidine kinase YehU n=1 Tax=Saccharicrinis fermentans DSM 9555 = JCM 21142 TaxID=869213 RepID=W7Y1Q1_9BACT|nr:histidine kinase [Saccharicrinis fermentans]GAF01443.1 putative sensor-like histidine kinase YehU [Saccharicrinis fermentans DSM 9555 = JCM 21142]
MRKLKNIDDKCKHWRKLHKDSTFVSFRKRLVFVLLMASSFYYIVHELILKEKHLHWTGYLFSLFMFFIFTETVLLFDRLIAKRYPWHTEVKKRTLLLLSFSLGWMIFMERIVPHVEPIFVVNLIDDPETHNLALAFGILYMIIYVILIIAHNFHKSLEYFMVENEKLKQDKILTDYKALQDQVNPHFLFNNLSTLIAIIRTDKDKAITFAENFTDVYRYLLIGAGHAAIPLKDELKFLNAYTTLHIARIGEGLKVHVDVPDEVQNKRLPHLSLQVLVENAIKHNITSRSKPLSIHIGMDGQKLFVKNNKQIKESTYSTKTGLSNLGKRLKILTDEEYKIIEDDHFFKVEIPLID